MSVFNTEAKCLGPSHHVFQAPTLITNPETAFPPERCNVNQQEAGILSNPHWGRHFITAFKPGYHCHPFHLGQGHHLTWMPDWGCPFPRPVFAQSCVSPLLCVHHHSPWQYAIGTAGLTLSLVLVGQPWPPVAGTPQNYPFQEAPCNVQKDQEEV